MAEAQIPLAIDRVVSHAIATRPDLILLGTLGLSGLHRRAIGSVPDTVARWGGADEAGLAHDLIARLRRAAT